jgi:hypothetical protein
MSLRDEVRDPWSYVLGGVAGGLAWALIPATVVAAPVAVAVGAAVVGAKVLAGAFSRPEDKPRGRGGRRLPIAEHTHEAAWLDRAKRAQRAFLDIAASAPEGPVAERVRAFGAQTDEAIASLDRLAGQASAIRQALGRIDPNQLGEETVRLSAALRDDTDPAVRAERERSLASVQAQVDGYRRLYGALTALLARLESGALGLEGLVARLAEVVALAETSGAAAGSVSEVDDLATELDGLRAGLVEAEDVSTRAVEGLAPLPSVVPDSVRATGSSPAVGKSED